jgi:hypothetical protein
MTDKEQYMCLSCYFVGELDIHGRCTRCQSLSVATTEQLQRIDRLLGPAVLQEPKREAKQLRWWHFVCGPFESYVSNYRCTNIHEAIHEVSHNNYEWTVREVERVQSVLTNQKVNTPINPYGTLVEELTNDEYQAQWRAGNERKSNYYTKEVNESATNTRSEEATS